MAKPETQTARRIGEAVEHACEDLEQKVRAKINRGDSSWPPLARRTAARKQKIRKEKMLIITGDMRDAVAHQVRPEGSGVVGEVGIFDETVLEYAPSHEFGTKDGTIPERSFIRKTYDEEIDRIADDLIEEVGDAIEDFWKD